MLSQIPEAEAYYITFDIDGYDMTLAPGAASPLPGGITYDESMDLLKGICETGKVVAMDLVEVAPPYDPTGCTERLAALTILQVPRPERNYTQTGLCSSAAGRFSVKSWKSPPIYIFCRRKWGVLCRKAKKSFCFPSGFFPGERKIQQNRHRSHIRLSRRSNL